ncbi:MAG: hypothetical protein ACK4TG_02480 [Thermaurantiacus sp.]
MNETRAPFPRSSFAPRDATRIRAGMIALVLSGVMTVVGLWLRGPNPVDGHSIDAALFIETSLAPLHVLTWALLLSNLTVQIFAWVALWGFLRPSAQERAGFWGFLLSTAGNGLFLPIAGVIALTAPSIARLAAGGNDAALAIAQDAVFGPLALPFLIASAFALLAGGIAFGIAIWKHPELPRWAALPYVLHTLCLTFFAQVDYRLEFAGGPLLLVSGVAIAVAVWRALDADQKKTSSRS